MGEKVYLDGKLLDLQEAALNLSNPLVTHGVGLFETLRAYKGRPFMLEKHIDRLRQSAEKLFIPLGEVSDHIPQAVARVMQGNELTDARIRFTVCPPNASQADGQPVLFVTAQPSTGYPPEMYVTGMTVYVCTNYRQSGQDPLAGHKTTCYFPKLLALREARQRHCGEALWFTPDNRLAEGSMSNVFLVKAGKLRTPPQDTPVLPGITRSVVLELAGRQGIGFEEAACTIDDLLDADEVFLTNAIMEVMPVSRVERKAIGGEKTGPVTRQLHEAYRKMVEEVCQIKEV